MFICEECFNKRWPKRFWWAISFGPCEDCKKMAQAFVPMPDYLG